MTTPETITSEIQKLEPSAIIELFEMDATAFGGDLLRFHAGTNGLRQNLVWQGNTYTAFPIKASGFDMSGNGQLPRPKLQVANVTGAITLLVLTYDDLLGAKITRKRTLVKYLDAVNFPVVYDPNPGFGNKTAQAYVLWGYDANRNINAGGPFDLAFYMTYYPDLIAAFGSNSAQYALHWKIAGIYENRVGNSTGAFNAQYYASTYPNTPGVNPTADNTAEFPDDVFFIDRKATETRDLVEFELAAAFDVAGVQLPRRQIIQNVCVWRYRGGECGYTGTNYFDANDAAVGSAGLDVCGKRLTSCEARFGANNPLPFGSFPAAGLTR